MQLANKLFFSEDRQMGKVSFSVLNNIMSKLGGVWWFVLVYLLSQSMILINVFGNAFMLKWSQNFETSDTSRNSAYLSSIWFARTVFAFFSAVICIFLGLRVSRLMHSRMTYRLFHAEVLNFLERIPSGRILNRFTTDIENIDMHIMPSVVTFFGSLAYIVCDLLVVIICSTPYALITSFIFIILSILVQKKYISCKREFVRLEAINRSPLSSSFSEVLKGLPTIRSLKLEDYVRNEVTKGLDEIAKNTIVI